MATTTTTIKRTKFKLTTEQLLDMFYWLKLMRAFDLRLSILVKQGKVRSGVYTGIGQEAIIVGTCFALRKEDFICPLHRDLGTFLMKGVSLFGLRDDGLIAWARLYMEPVEQDSVAIDEAVRHLSGSSG